MKKPASKVAKSAQIQPKSQFLFHKYPPPWDWDFFIMTLPSATPSKDLTKLATKQWFPDASMRLKIMTFGRPFNPMGHWTDEDFSDQC